MSFLDLYPSGAHKSDVGHFASIVKLALADNIISEGEQKLLDRMANRLDISNDEVKAIIENPDKYPINPPINYDERIERLYNLTKMVFADDSASGNEAAILNKIIVGLGFNDNNAAIVADEAIHLVMNNNDLEDFSKAIKNVNKY